MVQFSGEILHFENEHVGDLLSSLTFKNSFWDVTVPQSKEILELTVKLEQESNEKNRYSEDIIRSYLVILCRLIERMANVSENSGIPNQKDEKVHDFLSLINQSFDRQRSVSYYAGELNITPNYLNMLSKKHLGKSAGEMITSRIILEAKRLLYHTSSDISQIAFELGYEDPSYFTRSFRRFEKKTPTEFREEIYKKYQHRNN
jgi:AraC-like DNA-binding protein